MQIDGTWTREAYSGERPIRLGCGTCGPQHICENDYLNGEVIRLDGALRFTPK